MKPQIGVLADNLSKSIEILSVILSDEMTLYIKTRKFHWNVAGESFMELHKLFQSQYSELEETVDLVAERIGKLGGNTIGSMKEFLAITRLKESTGDSPSQNEMLKNLLSDHESIIIELRKDVALFGTENNDIGTIDFLTGLIQQHETTAWVLRRYLK
ncbi:Dps family protein [Arcicella rosea]|uniref:Starvation-inducible DNA-binding protein n=1 Tax=Arcicella rosea TaxID=502909 RepID=A0A841EN91_9BACT|nr:DNA starvation/stationary phase protection protein [Arcicella rosea]MBB6004376.1 starvation-inducible DNA-binding protein [Arcicella rosea]